MKKIQLLIIFVCVSLLCCCCCKRTKTITGNKAYDRLYVDSFEKLLHSETPPYSKIDTIYTEMYIALKAMSSDNTNECAQMVCDKVDILMNMDTIKSCQIHYLEAKQIAQGILKDKEGLTETCYRLYNLYPEDSFEKTGSLGALFLSTNQLDSAEYYLNRCIDISRTKLDSSDIELRKKGILGVLHGLVLLNRSQEAKTFLFEQLQQNKNDEINDYIHTFYDDFDNYVQSEYESIKLFQE